MIDRILSFLRLSAWTWWRRVSSLVDGSAILLIAPALAWMWQRDRPLVSSVMEWTVMFTILAGLAIVVSRITFPHLNLRQFLARALGGDVAAAIVVAGLLVFVAWTMQTIAGWARPIGSIAGG